MPVSRPETSWDDASDGADGAAEEDAPLAAGEGGFSYRLSPPGPSLTTTLPRACRGRSSRPLLMGGGLGGNSDALRGRTQRRGLDQRDLS